MPHQVISWQESICLEYQNKAEVLERYAETVSSPSLTLRIPAVARLVKRLKTMKDQPKFSRPNVYTRDQYTCQYCGHRKTPEELNYDHVLPRSKGGKTVFENIATSCIHCNSKKDNRTPKQAGMKLLRKPFRPKSLPMTTSLVPLPREVPELWLPYLHDRVAKLQVAG
jgi:5-methylcytosine-specific restriction endonuclease McrA